MAHVFAVMVHRNTFEVTFASSLLLWAFLLLPCKAVFKIYVCVYTSAAAAVVVTVPL